MFCHNIKIIKGIQLTAASRIKHVLDNVISKHRKALQNTGKKSFRIPVSSL